MQLSTQQYAYAFALGYKEGLEGTGEECPFTNQEVVEAWTVGYEQGTADDAFGEINADILQ